MKRMALVFATAMIFEMAMAGPAVAQQGTPGENRGNQICRLVIDMSPHKNPGEMIRYIREHSDTLHPGADARQNPVAWLNGFSDFNGTVGYWVVRNCQQLQ